MDFTGEKRSSLLPPLYLCTYNLNFSWSDTVSSIQGPAGLENATGTEISLQSSFAENNGEHPGF